MMVVTPTPNQLPEVYFFSQSNLIAVAIAKKNHYPQYDLTGAAFKFQAPNVKFYLSPAMTSKPEQ